MFEVDPITQVEMRMLHHVDASQMAAANRMARACHVASTTRARRDLRTLMRLLGSWLWVMLHNGAASSLRPHRALPVVHPDPRREES